MNIIIFSWRDIRHPNSGGAEIATHEHAKYWATRGNDVTLFASSFEGASPDEIIDGVKIVRKGNQLGTVYLWAFFWYLSLSKKPDVIVDQFHGIPFYTTIYSKRPVLGYIHETAKEVWMMNQLRFPLNYFFGITGRIIEPLTFKFFYKNKVFMTVSASTKTDLISFGIDPNNIKIVNNGINRVIIKKSQKLDKTAIFLGALAKDKGIENVIETFSIVCRSDPSWKLWIVGKSDPIYLRYLKDKISKNGLEKSVKFYGFVNEKRKFQLLQRAKVFINPSEKEGWGLVNVEANSVGTPVVAYNVQGIRDSIVNNKTGVLVEKGKGPSGLAEATLLLTQNEDRYKKFSKAALRWSKNFDWKKSTEESLSLLKKIAK